MALCDRELLTFCNLTNLEFQFSSYKDIDDDADAGENDSNVTYKNIYELLDPSMFLRIDEENNESVDKEIYGKGEKGLIAMRTAAGMAMEYKEKLDLKNDEGSFLKEWEVVYGADNYQLAYDFFMDFNEGSKVMETEEGVNLVEEKFEIPTRKAARDAANALLRLNKVAGFIRLAGILLPMTIEMGCRLGRRVSGFALIKKHSHIVGELNHKKILNKALASKNVKVADVKRVMPEKKMTPVRGLLNKKKMKVERLKQSRAINARNNAIQNAEDRTIANMGSEMLAESTKQKKYVNFMQKRIIRENTLDYIDMTKDNLKSALKPIESSRKWLSDSYKKMVKGDMFSWSLMFLNEGSSLSYRFFDYLATANDDNENDEIKKQMELNSKNLKPVEMRLNLQQNISFLDTGLRCVVLKKGDELVVAFGNNSGSTKEKIKTGVIPDEKVLLKILYYKLIYEFGDKKISTTGYGSGSALATIFGSFDKEIKVYGYHATYPIEIAKLITMDEYDINPNYKHPVKVILEVEQSLIDNATDQILALMIGTMTAGTHFLIDMVVNALFSAYNAWMEFDYIRWIKKHLDMYKKNKLINYEDSKKLAYVTRKFISKNISINTGCGQKVKINTQDWLYCQFMQDKALSRNFYQMGSEIIFCSKRPKLENGKHLSSYLKKGTYRYIYFKNINGVYEINREINEYYSESGFKCKLMPSTDKRLEAIAFNNYIHTVYELHQLFTKKRKNISYKSLKFKGDNPVATKPIKNIVAESPAKFFNNDKPVILAYLKSVAKRLSDKKKEDVDYESISEMDFFPYVNHEGVLTDDLRIEYCRSMVRTIMTIVNKTKTKKKKSVTGAYDPYDYRNYEYVGMKQVKFNNNNSAHNPLNSIKDTKYGETIKEIEDEIKRVLIGEASIYQKEEHKFEQTRFFAHYNHLWHILQKGYEYIKKESEIKNDDKSNKNKAKKDKNKIEENKIKKVKVSLMDVAYAKKNGDFVLGLENQKDLEFKYNRNDSIIGGRLEFKKKYEKLKPESNMEKEYKNEIRETRFGRIIVE